MKGTKEARKELWNNNTKQKTKNKAKRAGIKNKKGINERIKKERNERRNNQKRIKEQRE